MRISDDDMIVALKRALAALLPQENIESAVSTVLESIAQEQRSPVTVPLLSVSGRVLFDLIAYPESSIQGCADRLGMTSANVAHAMTRLVAEGWGVRSRVEGKNRYTFNYNILTNHRDIILIFQALTAATDRLSAESGDITLTEGQ